MRRYELAVFCLLLLNGFAFSQAKLPKTPVREVTEDYFGTKVSDSYRWLENTSTPEVTSRSLPG